MGSIPGVKRFLKLLKCIQHSEDTIAIIQNLSTKKNSNYFQISRQKKFKKLTLAKDTADNFELK